MKPVAMSVVIGIVVGCIVLLLIITLVILYLLKAERMCFNRKGFKPENSESDAESGRSGELIQNGRSRPGAIPPDALYTTKRDANKAQVDNRPLYENVKPDQNDGQNGSSLVYASLDLPNPVPQNARNGNSNRGGRQFAPPPRRDRTEYAEIQFQSKAYEQASL